MAEARRVQLTTLSSDLPSSSSQTSAQKCPSVVLPGKETHSDEPTVSDTVRLVLSLFEPDEQNFPEFSYTQLIENQISQTKGDVPLSRFEEKEKQEHDEVAAIARKLEEKYGDKPKKKKQQQQKKKDRIQDLIDIGYGYDEEDSFIDNSEAYDEFVPASLTTTFGGFYVNSGVLQFRQASDTETDDLPTEEKTLDMTKKRKLNEGQDKPKKKKKQRGAGGMCLKEDAKFSTMSEMEPHDELKIKKKKAVKMLSVTSMLKKFQREKEKEREKLEKVNQNAAVIMGATTIPLFPADAGGGGSSGLTLTDPLLSLIGSTNDHALIQAASTVDFDIDLDSLLEVGEETLSPKSFPQPTAETQLNVFSDAKAQNPNVKRHPEQIQFPSEAGSTSSPLPEGLPPGLEESIRKLTVAAKTSEGESKLKFFNPDINSILLDIELQCREQGGQLRSKVYTHLSSFLPCSRDTLLKRVKKLFNTHVGGPPDVEDPMQKLKAAIGRSMPEQIACFHEHCQVYEQVRISKASLEDSVEEKGGKKGGPKKLFKWNEEIRECFSHVLRAKMDKYKKEGKSAQEIEENLKILLDNEVKPLWPKGWMQSRLLIKESGKLLGLFTALPVKKIKSGKKPSSISSGSTLPDGCDSLQGTRSLSGELQGTDPVFAESLNVSTSESLGAKQGAVKGEVKVVLGAGLTTPAESEGPPVNTTSAPTHSFLDLLADQALAHEQPLTVSQELLAVAVAKYKHSVQHWSLSVDTRSPPLPPAPPHSSPVDFPLNRVCQVTVPRLLLAGEGKRDDADEVHIISDDSDISTQ